MSKYSHMTLFERIERLEDAFEPKSNSYVYDDFGPSAPLNAQAGLGGPIGLGAVGFSFDAMEKLYHPDLYRCSVSDLVAYINELRARGRMLRDVNTQQAARLLGIDRKDVPATDWTENYLADKQTRPATCEWHKQYERPNPNGGDRDIIFARQCTPEGATLREGDVKPDFCNNCGGTVRLVNVATKGTFDKYGPR